MERETRFELATSAWEADALPTELLPLGGLSPGQFGAALAQQSLRGVPSYCNARHMTAPEAYVRYSSETFPGDGEVADESTKGFLTDFMEEFCIYIARLLTVIPRP